MNALVSYFQRTKATPESKHFPFYVVYRGRNPGVYNNYPEVVKQVADFPRAWWKGFYNINDALESARIEIGFTYYIEHGIRSMLAGHQPDPRTMHHNPSFNQIGRDRNSLQSPQIASPPMFQGQHPRYHGESSSSIAFRHDEFQGQPP